MTMTMRRVGVLLLCMLGFGWANSATASEITVSCFDVRGNLSLLILNNTQGGEHR